MTSPTQSALVTGGAGFIGSALVFELLEANWSVTILDSLTYAAAPATVASLNAHPNCTLIEGDIRDRSALRDVFKRARPDAVFHVAAETHVDRSIDAADDFISTNVLGTFEVLEACRAWRDQLTASKQETFTLLHVSTDEVFGDLESTGRFDETTPYAPSSPYSASKAGSDHLVRAWARTYGLDVRISNCSNNYGPRQFPEKLIPLMLLNGLQERPLPVYGDGAQVRDWLHVTDHARALIMIASKGQAGETYCVGGDAERTNLSVVQTLCDLLDEKRPVSKPRRDLIEFVTDRPGHDRRYAIDASKLKSELGWSPRWTFETGLSHTLDWYLDNEAWWAPLAQTYDRSRLGSNPA